MTEQTNFVAATVLASNIDTIVAGFGQLTDEQLKALAEAEAGADGQKRTTLLGQIEAEQKARERTGQEAQIRALAEQAGVTVYFETDLAAVMAEKIAEHTAATDRRIKTLETKLSNATKKAATASTVKDPTQLVLSVDAKGPYLQVAFTGDDGMTIADVPVLTFTAADFTLRRGDKAVVLDEKIEFPESAKRTEVSKVWLLGDDGKGAACITLITPLPIGGGSRATIPAGHLAFSPYQG